MDVRDFVVVGSSALRRANSCVEEALRRWCADWAVTTDRFEVRARVLDSRDGTVAGTDWRRSDDDRWVCVPDAFVDLVRGSIIAGAASGTIADDLAHAGCRAFLGEVLGFKGSCEAGALPVQLLREGAGATLVEVAVQGIAAALVLPHRSAVPGIRAAAAKSADSNGPTVEGVCLTLCAQLATVELSADSFRTLSIGDVVQLGVGLASPVQVLGPHGEAFFHGHLCAQGGRRALDLTPISKGDAP